ncbi:MAG: 16S rRNA pseudouridine(516) synthase [Verrucomicrobiales bacterium]|nr:16S rRNA pseudouridine(516) synthase [Verrucomicrobiales bacterium]
MRLDHFIAKKLSLSERSARTEIASGKVSINAARVTDHLTRIDRFCEISCREKVIQEKLEKRYIMLNKPPGYLSATSDPVHPTVVDLIDLPDRETLHLAGRLDRASTGLLLLTNDSGWSEQLSHPDSKVPKVYLVETIDPIPDEAVLRFAEGFRFDYEDIITRPAKLEILAPRLARVTIHEGKYHQIKRMFHRINENRLKSLHRIQIGDYHLPDHLQPGEWVLL